MEQSTFPQSSTELSTVTPRNQKLNAALVKTQGMIEHATKSKENPAFARAGKKSTYADIADVIEVIQKAAASNGLAVTFNFKTTMNGEKAHSWIQYVIRHDSGESEASDWIRMFLSADTAHGFGAANTYYRRQLLKAIYQIPEEDDDGNLASGKASDTARTGRPAPKNHAPGASPTPDEIDQALGDPFPPDQEATTYLDELRRAVAKRGIPAEKVKGLIKLATGSTKLSTELSADELKKVIGLVEKMNPEASKTRE